MRGAGSPRAVRCLRAAVAAALGATAAAAHGQTAAAAATDLADAAPRLRWFVDAGTSADTRTVQAGVSRDWRARWHFGQAVVSGTTEGSIGRWIVRHDARADRAGYNRIALTPIFRLGHEDIQGAFIEAAVGANLFEHVYRTRDKSFSTAFQFGDHVGIGYRLPGAARWEAVLRYEHFSNASIKRPNLGEEFVQLRIGSTF